MPAEVNVFVEGGHIKMILPANLEPDDPEDPESGMSMVEPTAAEVIKWIKDIQAEALAQGVNLDRRGAPAPAGTGSASGKVEAPAPSGKVPSHCGQPCEYKPSWFNNRTKKQVPPKYVCRAGSQCSDVTNGSQYPYSIFQDRWEQEQGG